MPRQRGPELSPQLRSIILELRSLRYSYAFIAKRHFLPRSTVINVVKRAKIATERATSSSPSSDHTVTTSKPRSGRPRVINEEQRDELYDVIAHQKPGISYAELQAQYMPTACIRSIQRVFQAMRIRKWRKLQRPLLTQ
jgi:transposase